MNSAASGILTSSAESVVSSGTQSRLMRTGHNGAVSGRSEALAQNLIRLQQREAERLNPEEQERLARLREKARLD